MSFGSLCACRAADFYWRRHSPSVSQFRIFWWSLFTRRMRDRHRERGAHLHSAGISMKKDLTWIMSSYSSKRNQIYPTRYDRRRCHALFICHFFWFINYGDNTVSDLVLFCTGSIMIFSNGIFIIYIFLWRIKIQNCLLGIKVHHILCNVDLIIFNDARGKISMLMHRDVMHVFATRWQYSTYVHYVIHKEDFHR